MSGFVGILHLDGVLVEAQPAHPHVDPQLLRHLTNFLSFRGPDAQEVWCDGPVGLGHALLQVTSSVGLQKQPAQLDGRLWIVADARIDARDELIGKLKAKSPLAHALSLSSPDAELILHAYDTWGEACVEHLLGDFSFAIWDVRERRLFCARDQFGVKPFFYAHVGSHFIFSNTLDCDRMHPAVSSNLNDLAIADFLLFDMNTNMATTSFTDIQRLPPAHILTCEQGKVAASRYWTLSVTTPVHYSSDQEYVEHFRELLDSAVGDRLRTESAGVLMSGGLDSSTVAASAQRIFEKNGKVSGLRAYTQVFDHLIPHEERHYAGLVANALSIPIEYLIQDDLKIFERAAHLGNSTPELRHLAWPDTTADVLLKAVGHTRVVFTGFGADPALSGRISVHFRQLLKTMHLGRTFRDAARYFSAEGRLQRLYLRKRWGLLFQSKDDGSGYPPWLNEEFEARWKLRDRWDQRGEAMTNSAGSTSGARPEAFQPIVDSGWVELFEGNDPGLTHVPVEVRYPFFDIRLVNFLLTLPRLPWCCDKQLLREAGRGILPDSVRLRRKSPLIAEPLPALLKRPESAWVDQFEAVPELEKYVIRGQIPAVFGEGDSLTGWVHLRPLSLNFWLRHAPMLS